MPSMPGQSPWSGEGPEGKKYLGCVDGIDLQLQVREAGSPQSISSAGMVLCDSAPEASVLLSLMGIL